MDCGAHTAQVDYHTPDERLMRPNAPPRSGTSARSSQVIRANKETQYVKILSATCSLTGFFLLTCRALGIALEGFDAADFAADGGEFADDVLIAALDIMRSSIVVVPSAHSAAITIAAPARRSHARTSQPCSAASRRR